MEYTLCSPEVVRWISFTRHSDTEGNNCFSILTQQVKIIDFHLNKLKTKHRQKCLTSRINAKK